MTIANRDQLVDQLARNGLMGLARAGDLDVIFEGGSAGTVTADSITDATTVGKSVLKATDAATARTAIGAGTSSLVIGAAASQAKAGNYTPTSAEVSAALKAKAQITALTAVSVADATDLPTAQALANANKAAINLIIAALKA